MSIEIKSRKRVIDHGEVFTPLGLVNDMLYMLAQEGMVSGQKVGRHWRFHRSAIDDWLGSDHCAAGRSPRQGCRS